MKLTHIRIKDFRSFSGEHEFDVSSGVNYFVGPNNCGKSNLIKALELALDSDVDPEAPRAASSEIPSDQSRSTGHEYRPPEGVHERAGVG